MVIAGSGYGSAGQWVHAEQLCSASTGEVQPGFFFQVVCFIMYTVKSHLVLKHLESCEDQ